MIRPSTLALSLALAAVPALHAQVVFTPPSTTPLTHGGQALVGDLNEDGIPDAVVGVSPSFGFVGGQYTVMIGQGDGTFVKLPPVTPGPLFTEGQGLALVDWDVDGHLDLVFTANSTIAIRFGLGDGTFGFGDSIDIAPVAATELIAFDADGDAFVDLAIVNPPFIFSPTGSITLVTRPGGAITAEALFPAAVAERVSVDDLDGDGDLDLFTANPADGNISYFENLGGGSFSDVRVFSVGGTPRQLAHGDFDGDGSSDVAAIDGATNQVRVFRGLGGGLIDVVGIDADVPGTDLRQIGVGDLDDDGVLDLAVSAAATGDMTVLRGVGDGTFDVSAVVTLGLPFFGLGIDIGPIIFADLDLDGRDDLAGYLSTPARLSVLMNRTYGPTSPFLDLGQQLPGTNGYPIQLASGTLLPGDPYAFELLNGKPDGSTSYVVGFSQADIPFKGGTMVPSVDVLITPLPMDGNGDLTLTGPWPSGIPSGFTFYLQFWFQDDGGVFGRAGSNALRVTAP